LTFAATIVSAFGLLLFPCQSKSFYRLFKDLKKWVLLSALALIASTTSNFILKLANQTEIKEYSYVLWVIGTVVHELAGGFLAHSLYEDYMKEPDDSTVQFLEVRIRVMQGRNLVAKDTNIFGKPTTSDPYVKIFHNHHYVGETAIVWKTLNPQWNNEHFHLPVVQKTLGRCNELTLHIMDRDKFSTDDPMGSVRVPIPKDLNMKVLKWYKVHKGSPGPYYCPDPTGELQVEVELRQLLSKRFKRQISRKSDPRQLLSSLQIDPAMPAKSTRRLLSPEIILEDDSAEFSETQTYTTLTSQGTNGGNMEMDASLSSSTKSKRRRKTLSPFGGKKRFSTMKKMSRISLSPKRNSGSKRVSFIPKKQPLKEQ
jgi:hypothetical protein